MRKLLFVFICSLAGGVSCLPQNDVDYMANNLNVTFEVVDNFMQIGFSGLLTLGNNGQDDISGDDWQIYFTFFRMMQPDLLLDPDGLPRPEGAPIGSDGFRVFHESGSLFRIEPPEGYAGISAGASLEIPFNASSFLVARTDTMPRFYVSASGASARVITFTASEALDHTGTFDAPDKWKRHPSDRYDPYEPIERYDLNQDRANRFPPPGYRAIIPTPEYLITDSSRMLDISTGDWLIIAPAALENEARFLADNVENVAVVIDPQETPTSRYISLTTGDTGIDDNNAESYELVMEDSPEYITVRGQTSSGAYYGVQTLLALYDNNERRIPAGNIRDYPRFPYRGMHIDVSRNFQPLDTISRLLQTMGRYKLNKLHFHLTDDEGWRLEIPGLPELTDIGAMRCHSADEYECLQPQLGSGPSLSTSGSGYYTVDQYQELLRVARDHHIEVIPEFDMPGHAHAPTRAMEARYHRLKDENETAAMEFLLRDLNDTSRYLSIQNYVDNAIDPCIDSTYNFVSHVVQEVVRMHAGIQELEIFHFGGDEVARGAWEDSAACQLEGQTMSGQDLRHHWKEEFARRVAAITHDAGLNMGAWEDGLMPSLLETYNRTALPNDEVYAHAWDNIWEAGRGTRAYVLANNGFRVVISHATHLYFDHAQEPDPEERGLYWATRFIDVFKTFGYVADDVYKNIDTRGNGDEIDREEICAEHTCEPLVETQNVVAY